MSTLKVDTILKRTGTGTITIGQSGDTISIPSGATLSVSGSTSGLPDNTPYFEATLGSNPTLSDDTFTKVTFASERVDSNSAYDTSTGRFTVPSGEAGKYLINSTLTLDGDSNSNLDAGEFTFYKNGSDFGTGAGNIYTSNPIRFGSVSKSIIMDLAVSDYVEVYASIQSGDSSGGRVLSSSNFIGFKLGA